MTVSECLEEITKEYYKELEEDYKKIQYNWNSLREYIRKGWYCFDVEFEVAKNILDKMNELEGKDKE